MSDNNQAQDKTFDVDSVPEDATVDTAQAKEYAPLEEDTYQVEVAEVVLKENPFYKPEDTENFQSKYQFGFTFIILDEGEFRGRRIWDNTGLSLKPTTKRGKGGATKLYKIVTRAMKTEFDWDMCASFAPDTKTLYKNLKENVEGHQLKVTIQNNTNPDSGKTRSKVVSYMNSKKDMPKYDAEAEKAKRDAADKEADASLVSEAEKVFGK